MIKNCVLIFLMIFSFSGMSQRTSSSPYSFFGVGEQFNNKTVEEASMGGVGVAFNHYKYLNFSNPAAYANLRYTTYSFGLLNNNLTVETNTAKQTSNGTSLSYVALAFPIGSKAGFSFGIQPLSSIGYYLVNTDETNVDVPEITIFSGNGGVNKLYGAFGIKLLDELSLGIQGEYNFGNIENSVINQRAGVSLATKYEEVSIVRGNALTLGLQYQKQLKNKMLINAGVSSKLENKLKVTGDDYLYSTSFSSLESEVAKDTLSTSTINGSYILPLKTTVGFGVGKLDKWYVAAEYQFQDAFSTAGFLNSASDAFAYGNSNRYSLGGFFIPKITSISSYWERVTYRAGVRFEKTGLLVNPAATGSNFSSIEDFGISFGLGLPLKRLSTVNLGFEYGTKGSIENNLIKENYFNFRVSLSLTDTNWFIKRKID